MGEDRLYTDPDLARFYDLENGWCASLDYCRSLAQGCASVLDLGCGTGLFAATVAHDDRGLVAGVDLAPPMLDIAALRPGGDRVRWIAGDARDVRLERRFDLVVLTGHAFQVFLTAEDRIAVLRTIACHLMPGGRFIFDSRNPAMGAWRGWTPDASARMIEHGRLGPVRAWNDVSRDPATGIVTYETHYEVVRERRVYSSRSKIAFPSKAQIASEIDEAGLMAELWLGDWSGTPLSASAPEIIPIGRHR